MEDQLHVSILRHTASPSDVYNKGLISNLPPYHINIGIDILDDFNGSAWFHIHNPMLAMYHFEATMGKILLIGRPYGIAKFPDFIIGWVNETVPDAAFDVLNQTALRDPIIYHSIPVSFYDTLNYEFLEIDPLIVYAIPANHAVNFTIILKPTAACQDAAMVYFNYPAYDYRNLMIVEDLGPTLNLTFAQWEELMTSNWSGMLNLGLRDVDKGLFKSAWCKDLMDTYYGGGYFNHYMSTFDWSNGGSSGGGGGGTGGGGGSISSLIDSLKGQGGTILLVIGIVGVIYLMCKCRGKAPNKAAEGTAKRAPQPAQPSSGSDDTIKLLCLTMLSENVANHRDRVQNQIRMSRTNDPELEYKRKLLE